MELEFEKQELSCLRRITGDTVTGEQTQEVRLPEGMPDALSVVAVWGQVLLRSKEWRSGGMNVSGGVMAWVLYSAEDGSLHSVDAWLPFQMKWDFPEPGRDGRICAWGCLQSMDARCLSARKLMLRSNVTLCGQAYVKDIVTLPEARQLPEDIALKMPTYPMRLVKEVGEHAFSLEETLAVPDMDTCVYHTVEPVITEQRVMGDKLVFRGVAKVHMLCLKDGMPESWDGELPFSQFCDLEGVFEQDAQGYLIPAITAMELEKDEGGSLILKCGITCQYVITDRKMLALPEDSYSTQREVKLQKMEAEIPCVLQQESHSLPIACNLPCEGARIIDGSVCPGHGIYDRSENCYCLPLWGQLLLVDPEGKVKCESCRWEEKLQMVADDGIRPGIFGEMENFRWTLTPDGGELRGEMRLQELTDTVSLMPVLTGMEIGEATKKDPNRPSLILRRLGQESLWDVAKSCRTTVSAIQSANNLTDDCAPNKMLIIPIS